MAKEKKIKKPGWIKEFKEFAVKGNAIDMAVGVIIGGAFGKIVTSIVNDLIMPPIATLLGDVKFTDLAIVLKEGVEATETTAAIAPITLNYGNFIQTVLDFLIIAICVFVFIKLLANLKRKKVEEVKVEVVAPAPPEPSAEEKLLTEIRDLLKEKK